MNDPTVRLELLGGFHAWVGGHPIEIKLKRARLLLAYLALAREGCATRDELMALLWSDRDEAQARQSLRQTIAVVRRAFSVTEVNIFKTNTETVSIDLGTVEIDVVAFSRLARKTTPEAFEKAVALYGGTFLSGLIIRDPIAEDWIFEHRAGFQSSLLHCLGSLLTAFTRLERNEAVERVASRILELDPLDEDAHRAMMTVHLARGQRSLAIRQLQRCRKGLLRDLGVTPAPETEALIRFPARGRIACDETVPRLAIAPIDERPPSFDRAGETLLPLRNAVDRARARAPSLIVAPFDVLGHGERAELLAYGLVDDIVVDLSRFTNLFVVPPGPAAVLNLHPVDPVHLGSTLEIRFVLTGSVQESDDRVRVAAMLLDAQDGRALWADRYDRRLTDFLIVRDDLARRIATATSNSVEAADFERLKLSDTNEFGAWELCTLAQRKFLAYMPELNSEARLLYGKALKIHPRLARAEVGIAWTHAEDYCFRWSTNPQRSLEHASELANLAASSDPRYYKTRYLLSYIHFFRQQLEGAVEECARARADNPNDTELLFHEGFMMACSGHGENGFKRAEEALCLNPLHPDWFHYIFGIIALEAERYETALATLTRYIDVTAGPIVGLKANALRLRAAVNALLNRIDAARRDASDYLTAQPSFRVSRFAQTMPRKDPTSIERVTSALRSAGLPA